VLALDAAQGSAHSFATVCALRCPSKQRSKLSALCIVFGALWSPRRWARFGFLSVAGFPLTLAACGPLQPARLLLTGSVWVLSAQKRTQGLRDEFQKHRSGRQGFGLLGLEPAALLNDDHRHLQELGLLLRGTPHLPSS
jgi:hypothetical protein